MCPTHQDRASSPFPCKDAQLRTLLALFEKEGGFLCLVLFAKFPTRQTSMARKETQSKAFTLSKFVLGNKGSHRSTAEVSL